MTDGVWAREVAKLRAGLSPGMRLMLLELDGTGQAQVTWNARTRDALARRGLLTEPGRGLGWHPTPLGAEVMALLRAEIKTEREAAAVGDAVRAFSPLLTPADSVEVTDAFTHNRVRLSLVTPVSPQRQVELAGEMAKAFGEAMAAAIRGASVVAQELVNALIEAGWTPPPTEEEEDKS